MGRLASLNRLTDVSDTYIEMGKCMQCLPHTYTHMYTLRLYHQVSHSYKAVPQIISHNLASMHMLRNEQHSQRLLYIGSFAQETSLCVIL